MKSYHWLRIWACLSAFPLVSVAWSEDAVPNGGASQSTPAYSYATNGLIDNIHGPFNSAVKLLLNESNLGGKELEAAEMTIPAGTTVPSHTHKSVEIIYVLSGTYGHEVNGKLYLLKPGQIGIVRPGDKVRHLTMKDEGTRILLLWAPAGDGQALSKAKGTTPEAIPEAALAPGQ
jgi:quercetin dioxygenase-like cupin family protein